MTKLVWKNISVTLAEKTKGEKTKESKKLREKKATPDSKINKLILNDVSLTLEPGSLKIVLGPNGAGKTTLLRAGLGFIKPAKHEKQYGLISGDCFYGQNNILTLTQIERARYISYLPQMRPLAWPNRVYDIVALGRYAYGGAIGRLGAVDKAAIDEALQACDLQEFAERRADTLSGGELARVHCARAFAANAPLLIADEPVAALDPRHQFRVMELIRKYVDRGGGALVVLHDVTLAAHYADHLVWMKQGEIIDQGVVEATLSAEMMADIYGVVTEIEGRQVRITGLV